MKPTILFDDEYNYANKLLESSFALEMVPIALLANRRRRTTTLMHHGHVKTKPRDLQARVLSPTRRHNPQPLELVYQSPLHLNAQV